MPPSDLLSALLDLVHNAARKDSMRALDQRDAPATRLAPPLVDAQATARSALQPTGPCPGNAPSADPHAGALANASGVRRVSRKGRHQGTCGRRGYARRRSCLEPRRSIGPCNAAAHASCSLQRSARREERMREGGGVERDGRRLNTGRR
jgi:hypothetical protein